MRAARSITCLITLLCLAPFGCADQDQDKGTQESPNEGEDGGTKQDAGKIDPMNPPDGGAIKPGTGGDGDGDGDGDGAMTGCVAGREICGDGLDNDCDQLADERCTCDDGAEQACYDGPSELAGVGLCARGMQRCIATGEFNTWGACEGARPPVTELCGNGLDDDCDGNADEGCVCDVNETRACYGGPGDTRGVGACQDGLLTCLEHGDEGAWSDECEGEVTPATELCGNETDEDCDGTFDNGCACEAGTTEPCYTGSEATRGIGACDDGMRTCAVNEGVATWGGCEGDTTPAAEVCGNDVDEDCDGELDNECATLTCPADSTVLAGNPTTLMAVGSGVTNYGFSVTGGPDGGAATAVWGNLSSTSPAAQLTPIIVGEYTVRVTAQNASGDPLECSFHVTALPHGLRVQLYWDGEGDVDLHLINAAATRWSIAPDDTYWQNEISSWGAELDIDNVHSFGPENIVIDEPVIGMTYTIGVHHYARATGRVATVNVFCGNTMSTEPLQTWMSRPLEGMDGALCTGANDFWRVARVTFTSPSECTIEPIDNYITTPDSCVMR